MKKIVFLLLFNFLLSMGYSQSNIRLNNYWENTYYINPASIYSEYQFVASVAGRKQWIGFPGAPETEFITFAAKLFTNKTQDTQIGQMGLKIYRDKIGFTNLVNISPSYSYSLRMHDDKRMNLGFSYKIQSISYDISKSNQETIGDPAIYANETKWGGHNLDIGVEFISNSMIVGASSQNFISLFTKEDYLQTNTNFLYGMYRTEMDNIFNLLLGVAAIKNKNMYQAEFNVSVTAHSRSNPDFQLGFFYRTKKEFGVLYGIDISSAIRLACSYNYHVGGISHSSYGTPELLLIWKFGKISNCDCLKLYK